MKHLLIWVGIAIISISNLSAATYGERLKMDRDKEQKVPKIAKKDPAKAAKLADSIEDRSIRDKAYISLTEEWVKKDPKAATEWALSAEWPISLQRATPLLRAWVDVDPQKAGDWAEALDADKSCGWNACKKVAEKWFKQDPRKTRTWVRSIKNYATRMRTIEEIGWTPEDLEREEKLTASMKDQKDKDMALGWLVRGWAMKDHAKGEKFADLIQDKREKGHAFFYLAICFKQEDLQKAIKMSGRLEKELKRGNALGNIAGTCADRGKYKEATEVVLTIKPGPERAERFRYVLTRYYRKDEKGAKKWFKTLPADDQKKLKSELDSLENPPWRMLTPDAFDK